MDLHSGQSVEEKTKKDVKQSSENPDSTQKRGYLPSEPKPNTGTPALNP